MVTLVSKVICPVIVIGYLFYRRRLFADQHRDIAIKQKEEEQVLNQIVFFRPNIPKGCEKHILLPLNCPEEECPRRKLTFLVGILSSSRKSLDVCIHLVTSIEIARSLVECHKRGVNVRVICDSEMALNKGSQIRKLCEEGIPVKIPLLNYHMHSKLAIVDKCKVLTGSVNWTIQGMQGNWDNLMITGNKQIVKDAIKSYEFIWFDSNTVMFE